MHAAQPDAPRECVGQVELAAGRRGAAVDHLREDADAVVGDEDARAARQCRMQDTFGVSVEDTAACCSPASAQDATGAGSISGIVTDDTHAPAASVAVCVTGTPRCAVTASATIAARSASPARAISRTASGGLIGRTA